MAILEVRGVGWFHARTHQLTNDCIAHTKKRKLYVELWGTILRIYRASPHENSRYKRLGRHLPSTLSQWGRYFYAPQAVLSLAGAEAGRAWDYTKRPHVLRLTTAHGPQLLLRLPTHIEMISWIEHLQAGRTEKKRERRHWDGSS